MTDREKMLLEDLEKAGANDNMKEMVYSIMRQRRIKEKTDAYLAECLKKNGKITEQDRVDAVISVADDEEIEKSEPINKQSGFSSRKRMFELFMEKEIDEPTIQNISLLFGDIDDIKREKLATMIILALNQGLKGNDLILRAKQNKTNITKK